MNRFEGINETTDSLLSIIMSDIFVEKSWFGFLIKGTAGEISCLHILKMI
jgi:hypothetical protein